MTSLHDFVAEAATSRTVMTGDTDRSEGFYWCSARAEFAVGGAPFARLNPGGPMAFEPDILITTPDGIALVVEAKVSLQNLARSEEELKRYMVRMQCPIGLLITPEHMWLYRDFYTVDSATSVQRVGEFDVATLWHQKPPAQGSAFEGFVQQWLEDLVAEYPDRELPKDLNEALGKYIVPAVAAGDMRAAHVRY